MATGNGQLLLLFHELPETCILYRFRASIQHYDTYIHTNTYTTHTHKRAQTHTQTYTHRENTNTQTHTHILLLLCSGFVLPSGPYSDHVSVGGDAYYIERRREISLNVGQTRSLSEAEFY